MLTNTMSSMTWCREYRPHRWSQHVSLNNSNIVACIYRVGGENLREMMTHTAISFFRHSTGRVMLGTLSERLMAPLTTVSLNNPVQGRRRYWVTWATVITIVLHTCDKAYYLPQTQIASIRSIRREPSMNRPAPWKNTRAKKKGWPCHRKKIIWI